MRIEHLINGETSAAKDYFETVNPATQDVLAEVARGGAAGDRRRRARGKRRVSRLGREARCGTCETGAQARRTDREECAGYFGDRNERHRPDDIANAQATRAARRRQLQLFRGDVHARRRPYVSDRHASELHAVPSGRRVRADLAVECAVHDGNVESRALPRVRQYRRAEDERTVATHGVDARQSRARSRHSRGRAERRARLRQGDRRTAGRASRTCMRCRSPDRRQPATASCKPRG